MGKAKSAGPVEVKRGSFTAKIYPTAKTVRGKSYPVFKLAFVEPGGRRIVRDFGSLEAARVAAKEAADAFALGRPDALSFSPEERRDHDAAVAILRPLGLSLYPAAVQLAEVLAILPPGTSLIDAVRDYCRRHPSNAPKVTVREAVDALIQDRTAGKASNAYLAKLESHLRRFTASFTGTLVSLSGPTVGEWLRSISDANGKPLSNRTRQNHHGSVVTLFKFAKSRGWVTRDLADEIAEVPTAKAEAVGEVGIFNPSEIRAMLEEAPDDIRATLAIGAFTGLRTEEIHRLDWSAVKLTERVIIVGAAEAKTASRRVVPIPDALAAWLAPLAQASSPVDPSPTSKALTHRWCRIGARIGVRWKHNALRHSAISYRLAMVGDPARVAFESGNSPGMIARHYKALVTDAEGRAWFSVVPTPNEAAILPMPKGIRYGQA
jgi:integrase